ncbi:BMC domain-containing protein [bacterium]|nr:BMC domain-containing protein [bacterium]
MKNEALGFIETKGFTGIVKAQDSMPKTGNIDFYKLLQIGGGHVITIFKGELADLQYAIERNINKENIPNLHFSKIIEGPHEEIYEIASDKINNRKEILKGQSLALIETKGFVPMVFATDKALKSGDVHITNWLSIGGGISTSILRGDVASCHSAVEEAEKIIPKGFEYNTLIIENPNEQIDEKLPIFSKLKKKKENINNNLDDRKAVGVVETKSFSALLYGIDKGLKKGATQVVGIYKVGSMYISASFEGEVSEVESTVMEAKKQIDKMSHCDAYIIIPNRHKDVRTIL